MNQEDIIRMAREAGFTNPKKLNTTDENLKGILSDFWESLERFAQLVAAAERERVFQELLCMHENAKDQHNYYLHAVVTIRARGQQ